MVEFLAIIKIENNIDVITQVTDAFTIMGSVIQKTNPNDKYVMILLVSETQYIYLDFDKLIRDYNFHSLTIEEFMTGYFTDEVIQGNQYQDDCPLVGKNITTLGLGDVLATTTSIAFTNVTTGIDSVSIDDLATPDLRIKIQDVDHSYLIPIFDNKIYMNGNQTSTSVVIKNIKDIVRERYGKEFPIERLCFLDLSNVGTSPVSVSTEQFTISIDTDHGEITFDYSELNGIHSTNKDVIVVINGCLVPKRFVEFDVTAKTVKVKSNILKHNEIWNQIEEEDFLKSSNSFITFVVCKTYVERHSMVRDIKNHGYIYTTQKIGHGEFMGINTETFEFINIISATGKYMDPARQYVYDENYLGKGHQRPTNRYSLPVKRYDLIFQIEDDVKRDGIIPPLYEDESVYNSEVTADKNIPISIFRIALGA